LIRKEKRGRKLLRLGTQGRGRRLLVIPIKVLIKREANICPNNVLQ